MDKYRPTVQHIAGSRVFVVPDYYYIPRYTLPEEVLPGVSWPAGFREDFNAWSVSFLGLRPYPLIRSGSAYRLANGDLYMAESDFNRVKALLPCYK